MLSFTVHGTFVAVTELALGELTTLSVRYFASVFVIRYKIWCYVDIRKGNDGTAKCIIRYYFDSLGLVGVFTWK